MQFKKETRRDNEVEVESRLKSQRRSTMLTLENDHQAGVHLTVRSGPPRLE